MKQVNKKTLYYLFYVLIVIATLVLGISFGYNTSMEQMVLHERAVQKSNKLIIDTLSITIEKSDSILYEAIKENNKLIEDNKKLVEKHKK